MVHNYTDAYMRFQTQNYNIFNLNLRKRTLIC